MSLPTDSGAAPFGYVHQRHVAIAILLDGRVRDIHRRAMGVLLTYVNRSTGAAFPSIPTIAKRAGISPRSTMRAMQDLADFGYLTKTLKQRGRSLCNDYTLVDSTRLTVTDGTPCLAGHSDHPDRDTVTSQSPVTVTGQSPEQALKLEQAVSEQATSLTLGRSARSKTAKSVTKAPASAERFSEFFGIYPRKENKAKAMKVWQAKKLDRIADQIIAAVKARIAGDEQWRDPKYVPMPTTYLNGERWEDQWSAGSPRRESLAERVDRKCREADARDRRFSVADSFEGKVYTGSTDDELPPDLRPRWGMSDAEADAANLEQARRMGIEA